MTTRCWRTLALAAFLGLAGCSTAVDGPVDGPAAPVAGGTTAELRDGAVQVAERAAVALTSLDHREPDAGYDRLLALLTGPAREEWQQRRAEDLAKIKSDAETSQGTVAASGVAAFDPAARTATVLVAATATVSTKKTATPEKRHYRLRMSLLRTSADRKVADRKVVEWKVAELQFVS